MVFQGPSYLGIVVAGNLPQGTGGASITSGDASTGDIGCSGGPSQIGNADKKPKTSTPFTVHFPAPGTTSCGANIPLQVGLITSSSSLLLNMVTLTPVNCVNTPGYTGLGACSCALGFTGTANIDSNGQLTGCSIPQCAVTGYTGSVANQCTCTSGYYGTVTYTQPLGTVSGCSPCPLGQWSLTGNGNTCSPITCSTTGYTGTSGQCTCDVGYTGTVSYLNGSPTGCVSTTSPTTISPSSSSSDPQTTTTLASDPQVKVATSNSNSDNNNGLPPIFGLPATYTIPAYVFIAVLSFFTITVLISALLGFRVRNASTRRLLAEVLGNKNGDLDDLDVNVIVRSASSRPSSSTLRPRSTRNHELIQ